MSAAQPPVSVPQDQQALRLHERELAAASVAARGAAAPAAPPANAEHARILARVREMQQLELQGSRGAAGRTSPAPGVGAPADTNREQFPGQHRNQLIGGGLRLGAEAGLAAATGGLGFVPRVAATAIGEAGIEAGYGAFTRPPGERLEHVVEDVAVGGVVGGGAEVLLAGLGTAGRLGARVVRGAVSARAKNLEKAYILAATREAGGQPPASLVTESPMLTTIESYVEQSFGGKPLRDLRARNVETVRKELLAQIELVPSPQAYDLDAFLQETLDGRLDAARGHAAAYYKTVFDNAAGSSAPGAARYRPKVPADVARAQLADARLGFATLQDDTYKNVLTEMIATKGGVTFERMQRWRSQLFAYSQMFDPSGQVKKEAQAQAAKMAHQLTTSMGNAAKAMNLGKEWETANQIWADEVRGLYTTQMLRRVANEEPTKVARALVRNGTGAEVTSLRKALGINDDGSFRMIVKPTTPASVLAAKAQEQHSREAWRRVQGAHLWNSVLAAAHSGVDHAAAAAGGGQAVRELVPSGDQLLAQLFSRGDAKGEFIRALYNTPEAAKSFAQTVKLADTLRYYQATPTGGGIAMRVIETGALISLGAGTVGAIVTGGQDPLSSGAATTGLTMLLGERAMASLMASPRFVSALENGLRAGGGTQAAKRAGLVLAIEILRDSSVADEVRAQADAAVAQLSSAIGVRPEDARKAAGVDASGFISKARPVVTDRADVGGTR